MNLFHEYAIEYQRQLSEATQQAMENVAALSSLRSNIRSMISQRGKENMSLQGFYRVLNNRKKLRSLDQYVEQMQQQIAARRDAWKLMLSYSIDFSTFANSNDAAVRFRSALRRYLRARLAHRKIYNYLLSNRNDYHIHRMYWFVWRLVAFQAIRMRQALASLRTAFYDEISARIAPNVSHKKYESEKTDDKEEVLPVISRIDTMLRELLLWNVLACDSNHTGS